MIWRTLILIAVMLGAMAAAKARADDCPGNPNALGTSRVLTVDPREFPRIGMAQYSHSLPLEDKEVVLTFDDGPLPPYTNRVLDVLADWSAGWPVAIPTLPAASSPRATPLAPTARTICSVSTAPRWTR